MTPAHPRRCLRSLLRAQTPAPVRPQGLPLDLNPLYIPSLLAPPVKPLPYSACKQAGAGREVATHHIYTYLACSYVAMPGTYIHDTSHIVYMTPARPRSETSTRRFAHGGRAVARRLLARLAIVKLCARTPLRYVTDATSPPLIALLLVGFLAPVRPKGLP